MDLNEILWMKIFLNLIYRLYKWFNFNNLYINVVHGSRIFVIIEIYGGLVAMQII